MSDDHKWRIRTTGIVIFISILISLLTNAIRLPPVANSAIILILACLTLALINATVLQTETKPSTGRRRILRILLPAIATVPFTILFILTTSQKGQVDLEIKQLDENKQNFDKTRNMQLKQLRMGYLPNGGGPSIPPPNYRPLENHLQNLLGIPITSINGAESYADLVTLLAQGEIEIASLGAFSYLYAVEKCQPRVLLCRLEEEGSPYYYCCIIMKGTSGIHSLQDLKGLPDLKQKEFTIVDELSTSGYLMPRHILKQAGIDLSNFTVRDGSGSHQQVLQDVLNGTTYIGAISSVTYDKALSKGVIKKDDVVILNQDYKSESYRIPYGPIVLRKDIQDYDAFRVEDAFLTIAQDYPDAFTAQDVAGLAKVTDRSYDVIRELAKEYNIDISKLPKE